MTGKIPNPSGAFGSATIDDADRIVMTVVSTSALAKGDVVCWTTTTSSAAAPVVHISVQGTDDPASVAGVAAEACSANETVQIVRQGPAVVSIGTGTVAAWERLILLAGTPGAADGLVADATSIVGDNFGVFLGAEDGTTNKAIADIRIG
jgi:hypothetical protein